MPRTVRELVAQIESEARQLQLRVVGSGSTPASRRRAFKVAAGVQMTHIPYKGSSQAHVDLLSGQAQIMFEHDIVGNRPDQGRQAARIGGETSAQTLP